MSTEQEHYHPSGLTRSQGNRRLPWLMIIVLCALCWIGAFQVGSLVAELAIWMLSK